MPKLSTWMIRAALGYLLLGFTLGGLLLFNKGIPFFPALWSTLSLHMESLLLGWLAQLILGMAFWILPRYGYPPKRGRLKPAWAAFWLLNLGIWSVGLAPYLAQPGWPVLIGRVFQFAAMLAFGMHAWPRVRPFLSKDSRQGST